jgi:hypothetical protein
VDCSKTTLLVGFWYKGQNTISAAVDKASKHVRNANHAGFRLT